MLSRRILRRIFTQSAMSLAVYKARTFFIVAAVAMGIGALTVIVAAMGGASRKAEELADTFGPTAIFIAGGNLMYQPMGNRPKTLTWEDIRGIANLLPGVVSVQPFLLQEKITATAGSQRHLVASVIGSGENYQSTWNWPLQTGSDFTAADTRTGESVCLLGSMVAHKLFGKTDPVGQRIVLGKTPLTVLGVLAPRNIVAAGVEQDDRVVLPAVALLRRFNMDRKYLNGIRINFSSPEGMQGNADRVHSLMRALHKKIGETPDDFLVVSPLVVLRFVSFLKGGFGIFLGVTALAGLIVGGCILANLFHISVTERQTEIGLKKALGATSQAIMIQFFLEALCLTLTGAVAGLGLGCVISLCLERLDILKLRLSFPVFLGAFVAALCVALFFGLRPARKAASFEPVAALKGAAQ